MKNFKKPIIISGMPKTGTTPLGTILSSINGLSMIYEPFNAKQGISNIEFNYPFPGNNISSQQFDKIFSDLINLRVNFKNGISAKDSISKRIFKFFIGNDSSISFYKTLFFAKNDRLIIKDPFLIFCSKELSKNYKVIFCERPLKPLAASFKRMKWNFNEYKELSKFFTENELKTKNLESSIKVSSEVIGAIQFYELVNIYKTTIASNNIYYFSQNGLVKNPIKEIKNLLSWLDIDFTESVKKTITILNQGKKSMKYSPRKGVQHDFNYNKKFSNKYFSEILSNEEIEIIESFCSGGEI